MNIKICVGESCHLQGAEQVVKAFKKSMETVVDRDDVQLMGCFCMNNCHPNQVSVSVDSVKHSIRPEDAVAFFNTQLQSKE